MVRGLARPWPEPWTPPSPALAMTSRCSITGKQVHLCRVCTREPSQLVAQARSSAAALGEALGHAPRALPEQQLAVQHAGKLELLPPHVGPLLDALVVRGGGAPQQGHSSALLPDWSPLTGEMYFSLSATPRPISLSGVGRGTAASRRLLMGREWPSTGPWHLVHLGPIASTGSVTPAAAAAAIFSAAAVLARSFPASPARPQAPGHLHCTSSSLHWSSTRIWVVDAGPQWSGSESEDEASKP